MQRFGAICDDTAKRPEVLGIGEWTLTHYLAKIGGIKRIADGRYYVEINKSKTN